MPGDRALVAQQRVQVTGLVEQRREVLRRAGSASGPSVATASSCSTSSAGSSFAQALCWVPNSRRRSSRPSSRRSSSREARSRSEARSSQSWSRPADMRWISSASSPSSTTNIFPRRRTPLHRRARQRVERRLEGLHRHHARRQRRFHAGAGGRGRPGGGRRSRPRAARASAQRLGAPGATIVAMRLGEEHPRPDRARRAVRGARPPDARDAVVKSFDGTPIVTHFFPAEGLAAGQARAHRARRATGTG